MKRTVLWIGGVVAVLILLAFLVVSCTTPPDIAYRNTPWTMKEMEDPSYTRIRMTRDVRSLLNQAVSDILENQDLLGIREFYGPKMLNQIGLISRGSHYLWPKDYLSPVKEVRFVHLPIDYEHPEDAPPLLGIDIREIVIEGNKAKLEFCVFNVGGKNVIGGCSVYYTGIRTKEGWAVEFAGAMDP